MTRTFKRTGGTVRMEFEEFERALLADLHAGLTALLDDPDSSDPAVQRLFPFCVTDDAAEDERLRDLIHEDLLRARLQGLADFAAILDRARVQRGGTLRVQLTAEELPLVLGVLNDIRLTIGSRVGVAHLERESLDEDDPRLPSLAVMDHLAWWQEQLLAILDPSSVAHYDDPTVRERLGLED